MWTFFIKINIFYEIFVATIDHENNMLKKRTRCWSEDKYLEIENYESKK